MSSTSSSFASSAMTMKEQMQLHSKKNVNTSFGGKGSSPTPGLLKAKKTFDYISGHFAGRVEKADSGDVEMELEVEVAETRGEGSARDARPSEAAVGSVGSFVVVPAMDGNGKGKGSREATKRSAPVPISSHGGTPSTSGQAPALRPKDPRASAGRDTATGSTPQNDEAKSALRMTSSVPVHMPGRGHLASMLPGTPMSDEMAVGTPPRGAFGTPMSEVARSNTDGTEVAKSTGAQKLAEPAPKTTRGFNPESPVTVPKQPRNRSSLSNSRRGSGLSGEPQQPPPQQHADTELGVVERTAEPNPAIQKYSPRTSARRARARRDTRKNEVKASLPPQVSPHKQFRTRSSSLEQMDKMRQRVLSDTFRRKKAASLSPEKNTTKPPQSKLSSSVSPRHTLQGGGRQRAQTLINFDAKPSPDQPRLSPHRNYNGGQQQQGDSAASAAGQAPASFLLLQFFHMPFFQAKALPLSPNRDGVANPHAKPNQPTDLERALRVLDKVPAIDTHKIGVVYVRKGQSTGKDILFNGGGSAR